MSKISSSHLNWIVYLIRCADNSLYCGITSNFNRRLRQHNGEISGGAKYTQGRNPCTLAYIEMVDSKSTALKREIQIKKYSKSKKENICHLYLQSQAEQQIKD